MKYYTAIIVSNNKFYKYRNVIPAAILKFAKARFIIGHINFYDHKGQFSHQLKF